MSRRTTIADPGRIAHQLPASMRRAPVRARQTPAPRTAKPPAKAKRGEGAPPAPPTAELGASGTQNMHGIITGEEYLPALAPPQGLHVYQEMRNFAQVQASLWLVKAPILSSTPVVTPPKDGDATDEAIADFVYNALFAPKAMRVSWRRAFEHLMTRLDYGVSVSEKVWRYDQESGTWRLAKLAPRLATTIWEWRQDPATNELATIFQQALKADGSYGQIYMPASKCVVSTHQREGDNYWGRSILRSAYFHWFAIMELLRIALVRADRWGVGIPKAKFTAPEGWTNPILVAQVKRALKGLRSHEKAWLLEHPHVEYSMLNLAGNDGGIKLKDDIDFHATMIIQNVLGTFLSSQSDGMSTNRTGKLADVFSAMLELVAGDVAEDLDEQVVRELCDNNFVMDGRGYPTVGFTNIADTDLEALVDQYTRLVAVGGIRATRDDETHFRELHKLPPNTDDDDDPDDDDGGDDKARPRRSATKDDDEDDGDDPALSARADADPACYHCKGSGLNPERAMSDPEGQLPCRVCRSAALRLKARRDEPLLARAPTAIETYVLRDPEQLARSLNTKTDALESQLGAIRRLQLEQLLAAIAKKDARKTTRAFSDLRPDEFNIPERRLTAKAIREAQLATFADGRRQVRLELARQGAAISLRLTSTAAECEILELADPKRKKKRLAEQLELPETAAAARTVITTSAKVTAERLNDAWFNRILEVAGRLRRGGSTGEALTRDVYKALESEIGTGLYGTAKAEINEAFGLGRGVEAKVQSDEIEKAVWSCLLDVASCPPCVARDGIEATIDSEEYRMNPVPYKDCDGNKGGGDACRCCWIFLMKARTV